MRASVAIIAIVMVGISQSADAKSFFRKVVGAVASVPQQVAKPVIRAAEDIARAAPAVIAPVPVIAVKVIQGEKPVDAAKDVAKDNVQILVKPVELQQQTEDAVTAAITKQLGTVGTAIDVMRIPDKIQKEAVIETGKMAEHIIETGKVGDVVGAPLATAIRQAYAKYSGNAKPIPDKVRFWLSHVYTADVLNNARYAVDKDFTNIAAILNGISEVSGTNHAVTLNNIIVFSVEPNSDDVWWWGHEMQHTVQYKLLGIDGFAARYTLHWQDMENEANNMGDKVLAEANTVIRFSATQRQ